MNKWLLKLRAWLDPAEQTSPPRRPKARSWTVEDSKTWKDILAVLQYAKVPMTQLEISERLDVQTAKIVLPHMVRAGVVMVLPGTWPYQYVPASHLLSTQKTREASAEDRIRQRFYRVM